MNRLNRQSWTALRQNERILLALLIVGALILRLIGLGDHSFWFDEGLEINRALTTFPDLLFLSEGPDPPLFRLILAIFVRISRQEFMLRLPSVLFATASVFLGYYWLAIQKFPRLGLLLATFLAVAPVSIYYAQEVSQYSMVVFLTLLLLIAFERAAQYGEYRDWFFLWFAGMLALYTYYGLAWLFPVLMVDLGWRILRQGDRKRLVELGVTVGGIFAGIGVLYLLFIRVQYEWMSRVSLQPSFAGKSWQQIFLDFDNAVFDQFISFQILPFASQTPKILPTIFSLIILLGCLLILWFLPSLRRLLLVAFGYSGSFLCGERVWILSFWNPLWVAHAPFYAVVFSCAGILFGAKASASRYHFIWIHPADLPNLCPSVTVYPEPLARFTP